MNNRATDIDGYLASVPDEARATLEGLRRAIKAVSPDAVESISYGMPTFKYRGRPLIYFAAAKNHCSLYGMNMEGHEDELAGYAIAKGTIRFPPDKPLPESLVQTFVRERMAQIEAATSPKAKE